MVSDNTESNFTYAYSKPSSIEGTVVKKLKLNLCI